MVGGVHKIIIIIIIKKNHIVTLNANVASLTMENSNKKKRYQLGVQH